MTCRKLDFSCRVALLLLASLFPVYGEADYAAILRQAIENMATLSMSYTKHITAASGSRPIDVLVYQRKVSDGHVDRVEETLNQGQRLKRQNLVGLKKIKRTYYTREGCTLVRITSQKARGVRCSQTMPWISLDENGSGEVSGHPMNYDNVPCWSITEKGTMQGRRYVQVFTVTQDSLVILEHSFFNGKGQLVMRTQYQNMALAPSFPDAVFKIPEDTILHYANNLKEQEEMLSDIIAEEKFDWGTDNAATFPGGRRRHSWLARAKEDPLGFLLFLATYLGLPVAGVCFLFAGFLRWKQK